jgi:hypothetical protein
MIGWLWTDSLLKARIDGTAAVCVAKSVFVQSSAMIWVRVANWCPSVQAARMQHTPKQAPELLASEVITNYIKKK